MKIVHAGSRSRSSRRKRRRRLRSLRFAPTLLTLGNLWCGFAAIYFAFRSLQPGAEAAWLASERALPSFLSVGAGLIILGMIFDSLDGLVARVTHSTTDFGGQLDSLADIVTCGVAPVMLMIAYMIQVKELAGIELTPSPISQYSLGRAVWISAALYVAFAAIRLARFNVEHADENYDHRMFRGLPSPGAAAVLAALILFAEDVHTGSFAKSMVAYCLPVVTGLAALLMVSRIPYRRMNALNLRGRKPFGQLVAVVVLLAVFSLWKAPTLLLVVSAYGLSGPVEKLTRHFRGRRPTSHREQTGASSGPPSQRPELRTRTGKSG